MTPFFSVVISVYNKEKYIEQTIESVLSQTFTDLEIIIVNDGSNDRSPKIIAEFKDSKITVINQENLGVSYARNTGIKKASGKFIALLDGDDLWHKDYLRTFKKYIETYTKESVFSCAISHLYTNTKLVPARYNFKLLEEVAILDFFKNSLKQQILTSSSTVFKKNMIETIGLFDTKITSGEDIDYWIRLASVNQVVFINQPLAYYRYYDESLSNSTFEISKKPKFDKYADLEAHNIDAKKYINKNRYSLAIMSKLYDEQKSFAFYRDTIDLKSLNRKQKFLMGSPKWLLELLLRVKSIKGEKLYYRPLKSKKSS